jgi:hypothetical protein
MEQPPQQAQQPEQKMPITPEEFAQEAQRTESYLSLLPPDLKKVIAQKAFLNDFERLDLAIASIKAATAGNPIENNLLMSDSLQSANSVRIYNQALIDELSQVYHMPATEVAFMLDTPASLRIMGQMVKEVKYRGYFERDKEFTSTYHGYEVLLMNIEDYLKPLLKASSQEQKEKNKQIAIKYFNRFINHPHYSYIAKKDTYEKYPFDQTFYQFVRDLYSIVYDRPNFTFPDFNHETGGVLSEEAEDLNKRLEIALELDKSEQWLSEWTQKFVRERFWSLFAKSLMAHMSNRDDKKVNILINVLVANKTKIKDDLKNFLSTQPIWGVKTPSYQEFVAALWDYIEQTGRYELLQKIREFLPLDNFGEFINKLNKNGVYPLIDAIKSKNIGLVRTIVEIPGINVNICHEGHSALWHARNLDTDAGTRLAIIELLQHAGATEGEVCVVQ